MITQYYLPPDRSECVAPNPSHAGWYSLIYLPRRDGRLSWPSWLDSTLAGSQTSDLSITSPMPKSCTTKTTMLISLSTLYPPSWSCIILAFYPSSCMVPSAGQLPRSMYTRLMFLINGVCMPKLLGFGKQMVPPCAEWWCETENRATTSFSYCSSTGIPPCSATFRECQMNQTPSRSYVYWRSEKLRMPYNHKSTKWINRQKNKHWKLELKSEKNKTHLVESQLSQTWPISLSTISWYSVPTWLGIGSH